MAARRWAVEYLPRAEKAAAQLDKPVRARIYRAMDGLAALERPEIRCKPLVKGRAGLWRLRVGDYRVILDIRASRLTIVAVDLGHRSRIYTD